MITNWKDFLSGQYRKDLSENKLVEIDVSGYVTNEYSNFKNGKTDLSSLFTGLSFPDYLVD